MIPMVMMPSIYFRRPSCDSDGWSCGSDDGVVPMVILWFRWCGSDRVVLPMVVDSEGGASEAM